MNNKTIYILEVECNKYTGNFEREMGSYITGVVWEYFSNYCGESADLYRKETGDDGDESQFESLVTYHPHDGEHDSDYVDIEHVPNSDNWKVLFYFDNLPDETQRKLLSERINKFPAVSREQGLKIKNIAWYMLETTYKKCEL